MAYADLKYPKIWHVMGCSSSQELGLQVDDDLMLEGDGNGGTSSTLYKLLTGGERVPWGSGCSYSNGGSETVAGTHGESGLPFFITFGVSSTGRAFHSGQVVGPPPPTTESGEEGPSPGSGSWTAEQGG